MKKILLSIMTLCAFVTASADTRSWDFTKGADYATAISGDADNWAALSKGRYKNVNALADEELKAGGEVIGMTEGLKWTAAAANLLVGTASGNLYLQMTGGNVTMTIPSVTENDTIIVKFCSSSSGKTASITGNVTELSTTSTSNSEYTASVTATGDLALTLNTFVRIYGITIKPYVAAAAGECKAPIVTQAGVDPVAKAWKYVITAGEDGETLSYSTDAGTSMAVVNSGDTITVKPGLTVTVNATKGDNKGKTEFTAPEFTKEEKIASPAVKSTVINGLSYNIPALDNAGSGNGYAVKWRSNQEGNTMTINVNEGFALTKVTIVGKNNFTTGDITLKSLSVDGGESLSGNEFTVFNAAQDEQTITFTGKATKSIVLYFGDVQSTANQFNADVTIDWAFADEAPETENAVTFAYATAAAAVANFDDITLDASESVKYFEGSTPSVEWTSGSYTFSTYTDDYGSYGKYYYSFVVTNKTTTDGKCAYPYAFESACGGAKSGSNYAVWYSNFYGDSIKLASTAKISGAYVTNTTSVVDAVINGDGMSSVAGGFQNGDVLTLTFTGYKAGAETGKVDFKLAYAENDVIYYAKDWKWVDLAALGEVDYVKVAMTSTKVNGYGSTTPAYFCLDDFGGVAPATDAEYATATAAAIKTVNADNAVKNGKYMQNGKIVIVKNNVGYNVAGQIIK